MHRKLAESLRSIWRQMSHESIAGKDPTSSLSKLPGLFHSSFSQTGEEMLASLMCIYIWFFSIWNMIWQSFTLWIFLFCGDSSSNRLQFKHQHCTAVTEKEINCFCRLTRLLRHYLKTTGKEFLLRGWEEKDKTSVLDVSCILNYFN